MNRSKQHTARQNRSRQNRSRQAGLSMVEVLVAIFIISIGVILFGYFAKSLKTTSDARLETEAMISLRSALDKTRSTWSNAEYFSNGELPSYIKAPSGYTNLTVEVKPLGTVISNLPAPSLSCTYDYVAADEQFLNNCAFFNPQDTGSLIRHIEFNLSGSAREPLTLGMQLTRPIQ